MSVSYDIRNLKTKADAESKRAEFFRLLKLQQKLNTDYENAMIERSSNEQLGITPVKPKEKSISEEKADETAQMQIADRNLRTIMKVEEAQKVLSALSPNEIFNLNSVFKALETKLAGETNITSTYFLQVFRRYIQSRDNPDLTNRELGQEIQRIASGQMGTNPATGLPYTVGEAVQQLSDEYAVSSGDIINQLRLMKSTAQRGAMPEGFERTRGGLIRASHDAIRSVDPSVLKIWYKEFDLSTLRETASILRLNRTGVKPTLMNRLDKAFKDIPLPEGEEEAEEAEESIRVSEARQRLEQRSQRKLLGKQARREKFQETKEKLERSSIARPQPSELMTELSTVAGREAMRRQQEEERNVEVLLEARRISERQKLQLVERFEDLEQAIEEIRSEIQPLEDDIQGFRNRLETETSAKKIRNLNNRIRRTELEIDKRINEINNIRDEQRELLRAQSELDRNLEETEQQIRQGPIERRQLLGEAPRRMTLGRGKIKQPRYGRRIVGKGIEKQPETYKKFGRYLIYLPALKKGIFHLKFPCFTNCISIPKREISVDLKEFIEDMLENGSINKRLYEKLNPEDRRYFNSVAEKARIDVQVGISENVMKQNREDMKRFELVKGIVMAGQNSPEVLQELGEWLMKFSHEGKLNKNQVQEILMDLIAVK